MAKIIVRFDDKEQAKGFIERIGELDLGQVNAHVLSNEEASDPNSSSAMITPGMGSVEVRTSEARVSNHGEQTSDEKPPSGHIPITQTRGVQVMIEVEDAHEGVVRKLIKENSQDNNRRT